MSEFDFESIKNKAIEQLKAGKPLLGALYIILCKWRIRDSEMGLVFSLLLIL